jgi:hypothetical protein
VFRRRCTGRKPVGLFCMQRKMGTAENEIGKGESVCLWAEGKIVFLMFDTVRAQCKHKPVYQTGPGLGQYQIKDLLQNTALLL